MDRTRPGVLDCPVGRFTRHLTKKAAMTDRTESVTTRDFSNLVRDRKGTPIDVELNLGALCVMALDAAVDRNPQGAPVTPLPGELRKRAKLADRLSEADAALTLTTDELAEIERCVALHYLPAASGRILAALDAATVQVEEP